MMRRRKKEKKMRILFSTSANPFNELVKMKIKRRVKEREKEKTDFLQCFLRFR
jgi:hypothetical protein